MAIRYAVATGIWHNTATWSASSGGSPGASVPGNGDLANLDQSLVTVTVDDDVGSGIGDALAGLNVTAGVLSFQDGQTIYCLGNVAISGTGVCTVEAASQGNILVADGSFVLVTDATASLKGSASGGNIFISCFSDYPVGSDVRDGINYNFSQLQGTIVIPIEGDVKVGVQYGGYGTEFTGTLASGGTNSGRLIGG